MYLMKAYKTNPDNADWMAHVRIMDSMINSKQIADVPALQDNAKRFYTQLVNQGKWKKPKAVQNQSAFPSQSNSRSSNTNASSNRNKEWKFNKSLGHNNRLDKDGSIYQWCNGPGHNNRGMWVKHTPGTCTAIGSLTNHNGSSNSSPSSANSTESHTNMKKSTFEKKVHKLLAEADSSDMESVVKAITKSVFK